MEKTSHGSKRVTLYTGPNLVLNNYAESGTVDGNYEYGRTTNAATPGATTVAVSEVYFDRNKYQYSNQTATTGVNSSGIYGANLYYGGTSRF